MCTVLDVRILSSQCEAEVFVQCILPVPVSVNQRHLLCVGVMCLVSAVHIQSLYLTHMPEVDSWDALKLSQLHFSGLQLSKDAENNMEKTTARIAPA